jgi:hypothetical protein
MVAAGVIGLQSFGLAVFSVVLLVASPGGASTSGINLQMFSLTTALFAAGLGFVTRGLWRGLRWPRAAAVVWLVLLLPVAWSMVQAERSVAGLLVLATIVLGIVAVAAESRQASAVR